MNRKKEKISFDQSIYDLGVGLSLKFVLIAIIAFLIILLPLFVDKYNWETLGQLGDATGGFLNPIIGISAALLTFLAFYIQYQANAQVQQQFAQQQFDEVSNFEYNRFKERIHLIINDIKNFDIAFHEGKLITKLNELPVKSGKKYNFNGIQGLNLFLIEYFRDKEERENNEFKEFKFDDSYHSITIGITNLIVLFYNTHVNIHASFLEDRYKNELIELLTYVYQSKLGSLVHHFISNNPSKKLLPMLNELHFTYNKFPKKD